MLMLLAAVMMIGSPSGNSKEGHVIDMNIVCDELARGHAVVINQQAFFKNGDDTCSAINLNEALRRRQDHKD